MTGRSPTRLVLASANPYKVEEIEPLLAATDVELVPITSLVEDWDVEETGETLEENARLKALAAVEATGMAAVADDTGLFVDALGGLPGVRSSRYAGPGCTYADNVRKLLDAMAGIEPASRGARFRSAVVLACPDGSRQTFEGSLAGSIGEEPRGAGGFGYDPVFVLPDGATLAELALSEKNRVSHRGAAFAAFAEWVATRGERGICPCDPGVRY
ncbi:MAG TPA: RdgB/HAM1 family non-canonical purine NTP pyrophosphatase [Gemmatimonadota bacterium]|nr:RdgB/HAM1 family non-canonical purine NTP pyrophosphatase [Gemmatimonadota bacterium]